MADFLDSEAEESDEDIADELEPHERKKLKKIKAVSDSSEDEEDDDEDRLRHEMKDLIDDRPIEDESDADSDTSGGGNAKRKKSDDEDELDDRLEDEDYELIEENLGVKVDRKRFKRLKRVSDEESDNEQQDEGLNREVLRDQLFDGGDDEDERRSERSHQRIEPEHFDEDQSEESDADDFIVDDDGVPITEKKKKKKPYFADATLQEGQDIFGVDFDYDEFEKYEDDEYDYESEEADEYEEEGEEREKRTKKTSKKKPTKKSIFDIYEPSELKRGHFTDLDNEIRKTDIPERMQLREVPITAVPEGSNELDEEADWIYNQAFCKAAISKQDFDRGRKQHTAINKIKQTLDFIRNQQLDVPFISFYRKEYVQPELKINDLWKVYKYDAKWCQLLTRRKGLISLYQRMREYQLDTLMKNPDAPIPADMRVIKDEDIDRLKNVQTPEELKDMHTHFLLYYGHEVNAMQDYWKVKEKEKIRREKREARMKAIERAEEEGRDPPPDIDDEPEEIEIDHEDDKLKTTLDSGPYAMCRKAGICGLAKHFGLTPEQFAENLRDNYQRHDVDQEVLEPNELAKEYICSKFTTVEDVLHAAKFVVARQIAREPLLRKSVREIFYERAKLSVYPTKKGIKEIDENHACYTMKYLKNKPVRDLQNEQFLKLHIAEQDKLLTIQISEKIEGNTSGSNFLDEAKQLYQRDEFAKNVQEWNSLRAECVELALSKMVLPDIRKEIAAILLIESKDFVLKSSANKISSWISTAPYSVSFEEDDDDWETSKGLRIMGVAYSDDQNNAAFAAITNCRGEVTDYLRIPHILKKKNAHRNDERACKLIDLENITNFVRNKKPHAIVIGGESREALMLKRDMNELVRDLVEEEQFPEIPVEILDNDLAKIYANSNKGHSDFREYPPLLRQAISLARRLQDPLIEYSQLCTPDEEILCLRYHSLQEQLEKEDLLDAIYTEFINMTNEVGVDINLAVQNPLTVNLVQFICGLGPRKGQALIKFLKQTNQRLENRSQLVTTCHLGPKVFINCSGFIKIDTNSLGDSTEVYVDVLDGSRVHPETYEWARKMAVDALEYDDEDANPAGALEEILQSPDRLKDLDLDAFAVELERQGFGNKSITLYDIRNELNERYKDFRNPYRRPNSEELFDMLIKETSESFYVGKMLLARVHSIGYKKPQGETLDNANPTRNEESGLWQCPFCMKNDFLELGDVWKHFDEGECPGTATGVKVFLDNGLSGFIHIKNLSDKHVKNPEERVQNGQTIHVRVLKIDVDKFSVECTSKSSDLADKNNEFRPRKDTYYDQDAEDNDNKKETESKKQKARQHYIKRVIVHPSFHNTSYGEAIRLMDKMEQGEVIVRPSSKGTDHLTATWKVAPEIYQHIDVREEGKENTFSLGQSLWIGNEEFEDLDEIIARHINPMAGYARDLLSYKYYRDTFGGHKDKAEELLKEEKKKNTNKIHYFLSASKNYPGKFLLSYLPRNKCKHEYVTVTPDGFRFRQQMFDSVNSLLKWFKEHFKDPLPTNTPGSVRSGSNTVRSSYTTPGLSSVNNDSVQRMSQNMSSHMFNSLSQMASNHTPHAHTPGSNSYGIINTPYTPSGQTPYMTPYHTPHSSATPRYNQNGPFVHPGAPVSTRSYRGSVSPYTQASASPYTRNYSSAMQESLDWQKATDGWGAPRNKTGTGTPREMGKTTPRTSGMNRYDDYARKTPQYDPTDRPSSRTSISHGGGVSGYPTKSPRSIRSTPRTNASPHSMDMGEMNSTPFVDSTPLYDEN